MDNELKNFLEERQRFRKEIGELDKQIDLEEKKAKHYAKEAERLSNYVYNVDSIIDDLKKEFTNNTKLNNTDMQFLFLAVGLQCLRWVVQPKVNLAFEKVPQSLRTNASEDGNNIDYKNGRNEAKKYGDVKESIKYPNKKEILICSVPYDTYDGTEHVVIPGVKEAGKPLCGHNHHAATYGHDPIAGYVIGTMNILTNTITYKKPSFETEFAYLYESSIKKRYVTKGNIGLYGLIYRTIETTKEDPTRVIAAICKQNLHMQSDKYTKQGLPIPFIPADKAQELLKEGWNSNELERLTKHIAKNVGTISIQTTLSFLINTIIETLYKLVDDGAKPEIKEVKARKIIMYSNTIASTSNVVYTAISKNINNLDIGGLLVTLYRIATDSQIINEIKKEYVFGGFEKQLELREFNLLDNINEEE